MEGVRSLVTSGDAACGPHGGTRQPGRGSALRPREEGKLL